MLALVLVVAVEPLMRPILALFWRGWIAGGAIDAIGVLPTSDIRLCPGVEEKSTSLRTRAAPPTTPLTAPLLCRATAALFSLGAIAGARNDAGD